MAVGGKRSGQTAYDLNDESDLCETALDSVVGGTAGQGAGAGKTKTHDPLAQVSSLLHDAATANALETALEKMESKHGPGGLPTKAEQTLQNAVDKIIDRDAATFSDLSSKLSTEGMEKLITDYGHAGAKTTNAEIKTEAASIVKDYASPKAENVSMSNEDSLIPNEKSEGNKEHSADATSQISSFLHDAANTAVMQNYLDKAEGGADGTKHLSPTAQVLENAMDLISDKDAATLADPSSKLSTQQIVELVTVAGDISATTTNEDIAKDVKTVSAAHSNDDDDGVMSAQPNQWDKIPNEPTFTIPSSVVS